MTPHQLHLLDLISTSANMAPLHPPEREAVRAIMAERQSLLTLLERFDALDTDPHVTDAEWSEYRRDVYVALAEAGGGSPCGS